MSTIDRITMNPGVCGGRPCIRGLRIRVKDVLDLLAAGATREEILVDHPDLESEDITAVLEFAAQPLVTVNPGGGMILTHAFDLSGQGS
jgi:uncharacterized protein (DUF433 family)